MAWIEGNTSTSSRFLVVSGDGWAIDRSAEWFPVLAGRTSVATVQGTEWLPARAYTLGDDAQEKLGKCSRQDGPCLADWSTEHGVSFTHVYIPTRSAPKCCDLREALRADREYVLIYEASDVAVFARAPVDTAAG